MSALEASEYRAALSARLVELNYRLAESHYYSDFASEHHYVNEIYIVKFYLRRIERKLSEVLI